MQFTNGVSVSHAESEIVSMENYELNASNGTYMKNENGVVSIAIPHSCGMTIISASLI